MFQQQGDQRFAKRSYCRRWQFSEILLDLFRQRREVKEMSVRNNGGLREDGKQSSGSKRAELDVKEKKAVRREAGNLAQTFRFKA